MATANKVSLLDTITKCIAPSVERNIVKTCHELGFSNTFTKKEIAILKNEQVITYISRTSGLGKGKLHIVINPILSSKMDMAIDAMPCVKINRNRRCSSRFVSSSNYSGFNNIGYCEALKSGEHVGAGYIIDHENYIAELTSFLAVLNSLT
tara:strand:+ start:3514 stop:3966 length:453 start_codon:yes stop_codon:yes gene_type:complete